MSYSFTTPLGTLLLASQGENYHDSNVSNLTQICTPFSRTLPRKTQSSNEACKLTWEIIVISDDSEPEPEFLPKGNSQSKKHTAK